MAELFKTNLVLVMSPIPADFEGTPQEFAESMVERMEIQSPVGTNFFVVGDTEPTSNQGPWLKGGTEWYVFSDSEGRYIPLEITGSVQRLFTVGAITPDAPTGDDATIWLRTVSGRVIGWYFWDGSNWRTGGNVSPSGSTANRPSNPTNFEQYFDTDINCLIHWERGQWRTVSGTPGDIKMVTTPTLDDALTNNPGWRYLGELNQTFNGRVLGVATKDPGASPISSYLTDAGVSTRAAGDVTGAETHILGSLQIPQHTHAIGAVSSMTASEKRPKFFRVATGSTEITAWPTPVPPNQATTASYTGTHTTGEVPLGDPGAQLVTSRQLSDTISSYYTASQAHNNMQPTKFVWTLYKT